MKPSLADFPRCCLDEAHYCERDAWKADFEASLRSYVANIESYRKGNLRILYDENYKVMRKVKEILGDV